MGVKWAEKIALGIFRDLIENKNFLYRINYLFGIGEIYKYISAGVLEKEITTICKMVKDPVANIRATVVKTHLRIYLGKQLQSVQERVMKLLKFLENDED